MCDRHPYEINTCGQSTPFLVNHVIITSNAHPKTWYNPEKVKNIKALWSRVLRGGGSLVEHVQTKDGIVSVTHNAQEWMDETEVEIKWLKPPPIMTAKESLSVYNRDFGDWKRA